MDSTESDRKKCNHMQGFEIWSDGEVTAEENDDFIKGQFIPANHVREFPFE
jgi:hypothetical protein